MTSAVYARHTSEHIKAARRRQERVSKGIIYGLLIGGSLMFMLPLIIMVSTSLKSYTEINTYPPTFFPSQAFPSNYL